MTSKTHSFIAKLALACLEPEEQEILFPRWAGIDSGATLSDDFRIMWDFDLSDSEKRKLVHRFYVDSDNLKDKGCVPRIVMHTEGVIDFIKVYEPEDEGYSEIEFLENMGMFLGIISHHIADICTPLHVGKKLNHKAASFKSRKSFHDRIEKDIEKYSSQAQLHLTPCVEIPVTEAHFEGIAIQTYQKYFLTIEDIYRNNNNSLIYEMSSDLINTAVIQTRDTWHTVLQVTKMTENKWSYQPLL